MRSFLGWTDSAGGGSLFVEGLDPRGCRLLRLGNATPTNKDDKHRGAQREETITSEKPRACICRHIFIVPEEHERRMSRELHFVHVRNGP